MSSDDNNAAVDLMDDEVLDELAERGRKLYDEKIKPLVEPMHNGRYIAVHLDTGDYEVSRRETDAWRTLFSRHSDGLIMTTIIGPDQMDTLAYRMLNGQFARRRSK